MPTDRAALVQEAVKRLEYFAHLYGLDSLFVAGGYCRSLYLGDLNAVQDIDVASAYADQAVQFGGIFASEVLRSTPQFYERTGTALVVYKNDSGEEINIEFQGKSTQGYMQNEDVKAWLHTQSIPDVPLMNNIYGRDFTINAMIYSLQTKQLYDPTEFAVRDFNRQRIVSLLPAEILIKYNPLAITRAIRFSLVLGFRIDEELRAAMKAGAERLLDSFSHDRILKELVRILEVNSAEGLELIKRYNLDRVLLDPSIKQYVYLESE
jgi:tRNA nucleotidyltransferase/poly(A) polymerase